ncbi:MAG: hypothetical protein KAJ14_04850 [Candidatus Omnitrophica bacterium]|nr:hypothetical protein [Candidatus Omnitrophota bacterium]
MRINKIKFSLIIVLIVMFVGLEGSICFFYGTLSSKSEIFNFDKMYKDIYKPFFKKIQRNNEYLYVSKNPLLNYQEFSVVKKKSVIRIFILGGSVAELYGKDLSLRLGFKCLAPDISFEIINCGIGGYDSYRVLLVEKEILNYDPDLIIIFSGNNEYYASAKFSPIAYSLNKILSKLWSYRKLQGQVSRLLSYVGIEQFRNRERRLIDYRKNIIRIVKKAKNKKIPIILNTLPFNMRDCPPSGMSYPLNKEIIRSMYLLDKKDYHSAVEVLTKYLEYNSESSLGFFYLGKAYDRINDYKRAKENYLKGFHLRDSLWERATSESNKIIRNIGNRENITIVDLEQVFINKSSNGLMGRELLRDNCHWWEDCNLIVSYSILEAMFKNKDSYRQIFGNSLYEFNLPIPKTLTMQERGKNKKEIRMLREHCVWSLLVSDFYEISVLYSMETLFYLNPKVLWDIQYSKENIYEEFMKDRTMREYIIENGIDKKWPLIICSVGETYRRLGLFKEALSYFNHSIELDKYNYLPYVGKALLFSALGDKHNALINFEHAESLSDNEEIKSYKALVGF